MFRYICSKPCAILLQKLNVKRYLLMLYSGIFIFAGFLLQVIKKLPELRVTIGIFINKILSVVIGGNPLPLGGGRSLVNS